MTSPFVTVLLATYNGSRYLPEQLRSLSEQARRPDRIVVRDDGSNDGSIDIVRAWGQASGIEVQLVEAHGRLGPALSFLATLRAAGPADVYLFCDQDDFWLPSKIERAVQAIAAAPAHRPHLHATALQIVDSRLAPIRMSAIPHGLSFASAACESVLTGCTMAFNEPLARLLRGEPPRFLVMHDWWCYLLATGTGSVSFDEQPSLLYRQHGDNALGAEPRGLSKLRARLARFLGPESAQRSRQLAELRRLHGAALAPPAQKLLAQLTAGRQRPLVRLAAAFSAPIRRQSRLSVLSTRLSLLINRF